MAHTILPLRTLHYIKRTYPRETYHDVLEKYFQAFWVPPNHNLTKADVLAKVLAECGKFSPKECEAILAAAQTQEVKDLLTTATQEALGRGAFGAPWLWVTNGQGKSEPFFGSDRFVVTKTPTRARLADHAWCRFGYVYQFLGLPYKDIQLLGPGQSSKL